MDRERLLKWLDKLYATSESEIDCDRLQALLPEYVDLLIAGGDGAGGEERAAQARVHLAQCPDCAEEFEGLRRIAELERQGRLPTAEQSLDEFESAAHYEREHAS